MSIVKAQNAGHARKIVVRFKKLAQRANYCKTLSFFDSDAMRVVREGACLKWVSSHYMVCVVEWHALVREEVAFPFQVLCGDHATGRRGREGLLPSAGACPIAGCIAVVDRILLHPQEIRCYRSVGF